MSRQVVLVMEYCEGGSLASYLQEPDNIFGLSDAEFLTLLKHLGKFNCMGLCMAGHDCICDSPPRNWSSSTAG